MKSIGPQRQTVMGIRLVIADETAAPESWEQGSSWRSSTRRRGSPGLIDPFAPHADFDGDGAITAIDIDLLSAARGTDDLRFDLNQDGEIDSRDREFLIHDILGYDVWRRESRRRL